MNKLLILTYVLVGMVVLAQNSSSAPAVDDFGYYNRDRDYKPMPYDFSYTVDDPPSANYFGHEERGGDAGGRTEGRYFVLLPDGRLMTVTYYVDERSGYVPKITFSNPNTNPGPIRP